MASILVIEDDEFFQNFLELVLSGEGHDVRIAEDGDKGLAAVADARAALRCWTLWSTANHHSPAPPHSRIPAPPIRVRSSAGRPGRRPIRRTT